MQLQWLPLAALLALQLNPLLSGANILTEHEQTPFTITEKKATKRIAIVGGGTGGVTILKTLLADLPSETTRDWEIVLFEQRRDVGGVW